MKLYNYFSKFEKSDITFPFIINFSVFLRLDAVDAHLFQYLFDVLQAILRNKISMTRERKSVFDKDVCCIVVYIFRLANNVQKGLSCLQLKRHHVISENGLHKKYSYIDNSMDHCRILKNCNKIEILTQNWVFENS